MDLATYREHLEKLGYGKRLPGALYVYRDQTTSFGPEFDGFLARVITEFNIDERYNVLKFRLDELKLSFLSYPDFFDNAHPSLRHGVTVNLVSGKSRVA